MTTLLELPPEIAALVLSYLGPTEFVRLSWTCKRALGLGNANGPYWRKSDNLSVQKFAKLSLDGLLQCLINNEKYTHLRAVFERIQELIHANTPPELLRYGGDLVQLLQDFDPFLATVVGRTVVRRAVNLTIAEISRGEWGAAYSGVEVIETLGETWGTHLPERSIADLIQATVQPTRAAVRREK
jgi:hypothetical protein